MTLNVNIPDAELESLTGSEIKAHISAISGQAEKKIATRKDGLTTLRRLRMWSQNQDGLLGVPKDSAPIVRTMEELLTKATAKGKTVADLPKSHERVTPIDPEWDEEIVDGDAAIEEAQQRAAMPPAPAPHGVIESPMQPEAIPGEDTDADADDEGPMPTIPAAPDTKATAQGVEVKVGDETIVHPRGTMRARLAQQAAEAKPIELAPSAQRDRRPKKETGEARKVREALLGVRATFAGLTKNHKGSVRFNVLVFVQSKAKREVPGWPTGTVLPAEIDAHFQQNCKPYLHKLIEDGHLARSVPLMPGQAQAKAEAKETAEA